MKLNIGCSDRVIEGYIGVDIAPPADVIADLSERWPWEDSTVEEVLAYSVFEHLPNKLHTMNELHRILQPGGIARLQLPHATQGDGGHCDPQHCSYWTPSDFEYYCKGVAEYERFHESYGITACFRLVEKIKIQQYPRLFGGFVVEFDVVLEAVK